MNDTLPQKNAVLPLGGGERLLSAAIGILILVVAGYIFLFPPNRATAVTTTAQGAVTSVQTTTTHADPSGLASTLAIAGAAFVAFAFNGLKVTKLSAGPVSLDTTPTDPAAAAQAPALTAEKTLAEVSEGMTLSEDLPAPGSVSTGHPLEAVSPAVAGIALDAKRTRHDFATGVIRQFASSASWNGLKILRACQLAARGKAAFNLKVLCSIDQRMSFDYAYGFLVGGSSAGMFKQNSNPKEGIVVVTFFPAALEAAVDEEISRRVSLVDAGTSNRGEEMKRIADFVQATVRPAANG